MIAGAVLLLSACGGKKNEPSVKPEDTVKTNSTELFRTKYDTEKFLGEYMGTFGKNTLILDINYVNGNNVSGYNIVKGNRRNIKGTLEDKGNAFSFRLEEPGSDKYDGVFEFTIDTATLTASGKWAPLDPAITEQKTYTLQKRSDRGQPYEKTGTWYLDGFIVELKADGTGLAKGGYENKKGEWKETEIRCTWLDTGKGITIEWAKNFAFKKSVMNFTLEKTEYEEIMTDGDYQMYRYW